MAQHYSDPSRAAEPHALPDVETFRASRFTVYCEDCDQTYDTYMPEGSYWADLGICCPACAHAAPHFRHDFIGHVDEPAKWFWRACFPGCLPDGEPMGPFATEAEAIADAQDGIGTDDDTDDQPCPECERSNGPHYRGRCDHGGNAYRLSFVSPIADDTVADDPDVNAVYELYSHLCLAGLIRDWWIEAWRPIAAGTRIVFCIVPEGPHHGDA